MPGWILSRACRRAERRVAFIVAPKPCVRARRPPALCRPSITLCTIQVSSAHVDLARQALALPIHPVSGPVASRRRLRPVPRQPSLGERQVPMPKAPDAGYRGGGTRAAEYLPGMQDEWSRSLATTTGSRLARSNRDDSRSRSCGTAASSLGSGRRHVFCMC